MPYRMTSISVTQEAMEMVRMTIENVPCRKIGQNETPLIPEN